MLYILNPSGFQVYTYDPYGSFNFNCSENHVGQGSFSTGILTFPQQDKLVMSAVDRVNVSDTKGNIYNQTFTIDYNVVEGLMFGIVIDPQVDLSFTSVVISY